MLGNDISNRKAPSMLFRVEDFLVEYRETTTIDKVMNKIIGKHKRAELNEEVCDTIDLIFRQTDFSVGLVCMKQDWGKFPKDMRDIIIQGLPVSDIHLVQDALDIDRLLNTGEYAFYVDDNLENHSLVGHNRCVTLKQINAIARKGYKYE